MTLLDYEPATPTSQSGSTSSVRAAEAALLLATLAWGSSFTWAKTSGDAINRLCGAGAGAVVGPMLLMGARFLLAGVLWFACFPQARRGWTRASFGRGLTLGFLLGSGLVLQVLGLDRTSEAVSAFLTSLTILWVPAIMLVWMRRPPAGVFWVGVVLAGVGIWLMTGVRPGDLRAGEWFGLACSVVFSVHIIALNVLIPRDDPWRLTGAQFIVCGAMALLVCAASGGTLQIGSVPKLSAILSAREVWLNLGLLIIFPTVLSFGIMSYFQPRVDPTRATLIYLTEPVFAAGYAWILAQKALSMREILGGGLILAANLIVEILASRMRRGLEPLRQFDASPTGLRTRN